ncbi:MATE family efflux transporter [Luxibacter massiliensis]|uniref:MATE family efflux transporter n=1 Tax=Luxibacter massiliensis TaxID=2219695 RepID=UPI000F069205|nr:MATE family efflux transporter [Luxibacter massiliensis]
MNQDFTEGNIRGALVRFALPMMAGDLLQQLYNVADTLIVGQVLGKEALAAVGASYTLMTFLTSILIGLCMGSGVEFSLCFGKKDMEGMKNGVFMSFVLIGGVTAGLTLLSFGGIDLILKFMQVPGDTYGLMREYLWVIFWGITASFLYNFFAAWLRSIGNSAIPLIFLGISAVMNIGLDLYFVIGLGWGVGGAALATVMSQYAAGIGICVYTLLRFPKMRLKKRHFRWRKAVLREIFQLSFLTCIQQSVMNFGILMVQGLVNSFGTVVMAAFSAAVKIDSFAYMPVQDFGNAFSTFVAQNHGAGKQERIRDGIRNAVQLTFIFCLIISLLVWIFARQLMLLFVKPWETEILSVGVSYLRIEGSFYCLIGFLFLFYGFYRAVKRPGMSVVLTVLSLGSRVLLAYTLSAVPGIGVNGIWAAVPLGWMLADAVGYIYLRRRFLACSAGR